MKTAFRAPDATNNALQGVPMRLSISLTELARLDESTAIVNKAASKDDVADSASDYMTATPTDILLSADGREERARATLP